MPDLSLAERLLYSTVKLTSLRDGVPTGTGTGFFMQFPAGGGHIVPTIVTNKHVVDGAVQVRVVCHNEEDGKHCGRFVD